MNKLDELGLRQKLIRMGNPNEQGNFAWWLNREPLRSKVVGEGLGKTAAGWVQIVAHETDSFLAYESITRAHSGEPNVLISRRNAVGEIASLGDGFYTRLGKLGARGTGLTIRFSVDPKAREGTDFTVHGDFILFKNKKALKIIQESLNFGLDDLVRLAESQQEFQINHSDLGLLEKLKRRLNAARITDQLERLLSSKKDEDHNRLVQILIAFQNSGVSKLISQNVMVSVAENIYGRVAPMAQSSKESDILKYIRTIGLILKALDSTELLKHQDFIQYLERRLSGERASFELRREAIFEILLNVDNFKNHPKLKRNLSSEELKTVIHEIREWHRSPEVRKRMFAVELNRKWSDAIENGNVEKLQSLIDSSFFDINHKNISGVSMLQLAAYFKQSKIIDWLVSNPEFDFTSKNAQGFTEVEQLRLNGKGKLADTIEKAHPEAKGRPIQTKERNFNDKTEEYPKGTPIIDFVRIEPNSYMMGSENAKVLTTISKPFEFMSVCVTQKAYRTVVELIKGNLRTGEYNVLEASPSRFKGDNLPVEQVSYDDITLWKKGLNELSKLADRDVQEQLKELFPGHRHSREYSLPTSAQWELVSRLGGVAESNYSHGKDFMPLTGYTVFEINSRGKTWPVGSKKPHFYNGKPIYDLQGNVSTWVGDNAGPNPFGGQPLRIVRGGGWSSFEHRLKSQYVNITIPDLRAKSLGFRLVRTIHNP